MIRLTKITLGSGATFVEIIRKKTYSKVDTPNTGSSIRKSNFAVSFSERQVNRKRVEKQARIDEVSPD